MRYVVIAYYFPVGKFDGLSVTTGFPIKHLLRNRSLLRTSREESFSLADNFLITEISRSTKYNTRLSGDCSTIYYKHADNIHKGGYDTRGYGGILLTRNKSGGGYVTVKWVT